jgi:23S rRNA (adenine2503-C2)-methyltransferase
LNKRDLKSMRLEELEELVLSIGEKKFRAKQIFKSLHSQLSTGIDEIRGLSKELKEKLNESYRVEKLEIAERLDSKLDGTKKYLFRLSDGNVIESVFMKYKHGNSICISTQVGCRMGCAFCASTKGGLVRNLTPGEILEQFYAIRRDTGEPIGSIVLMGSGEPLDNFDNVMLFMELLHDSEGQNLSYRSMTLSTCGIVPKIYELSKNGKPLNLAISLHNPFDGERAEIMPIAKKYSVAEIIESCREYLEETGRRITFEYTLIEGENDGVEYAEKLADLLKGLNCHINLIPLNPISEYGKQKTKSDSVINFKNTLEKNRLNATVRRELGSDINAACGQLRNDYIDNEV